MPRRARIAFTGAGAGVLLLALTWFLAHEVALVRRADVAILSGFAELHRPRVDRITNAIAGLCDPNRYVFLVAVPIIVALARRRYRVAAMIALVLLAANETTQLLKPLLAGPRDFLAAVPINDASWPSGHATAAMTLALCAVIAAPARRRPAVAAAAAAFAVAVCYSFLELGWHYPSDVFGGFLVAAIWTLLGIGGLTVYEARQGRLAAGPTSSVSVREALVPVAGLLAAVGGAIALIALARPHPVMQYARDHPEFVVGAAAIGLLGIGLASGLALVLRRP
jgi:membrane-associated phospholipid phosphatase